MAPIAISYRWPYDGRVTTDEAINHFGSITALARALKIRPPSIYCWGTRPPSLRQLQLEAATEGKLRADADCDKFRFPALAEPKAA